MRKVWIEAALNGGWSRALQPGIPDTVDSIIAEGIACARAGATIVHVHAYDGGGPQTHDWQVYARIIEGIRNEVDVPIYPSYPAFTANGDASLADVAVRFSHIEALVARGLIEFTLVDPGSVNFTLTTTTSAAPPADTYMNPEDHVRYALDFSARHGLHPDFAISAKRLRVAVTSASALKMRRSARKRATSNWSKRPCASCVSTAPNRPLQPRCGRRWLHAREPRRYFASALESPSSCLTSSSGWTLGGSIHQARRTP